NAGQLSRQQSSWQKAQRGNILFAFGIAIALFVAWHVLGVLEIIYVSALFAVVLTPLMSAIMNLHIGNWRPGRVAAILILLFIVASSAVLFFLVALPPVIRDMHQFALELPTRGPQLLERVHRFPFAQHVDVNKLNAKLQDLASNFAGFVFSSLKAWASSLFNLITGLILTIYFMLEGDIAYKWLLSFLPLERRKRLDATLARAEVRMGKWLLAQGSLMLLIGLVSMIVFLFLHVRYAYALGVLMGVFNLVPYAGAVISMALVVLVAAIDSWGRVVGVVVFYLIYSQIETSYLTPRIMKHSVDLAGLTIIIALLLGADLAGIVGAMVAVPTAVLVAVLLNEYAVTHDPVTEAEPNDKIE
ncbi:MAG TPA: AI-2E family transporter, partial [Silvibacterium sp.]|nr:AI-2E family transporter [Silvibacterium sp.]